MELHRSVNLEASRARDLENDISGSPKPSGEIRMIDEVSGSRGRLGCIIRLTLRMPAYRVFHFRLLFELLILSHIFIDGSGYAIQFFSRNLRA